MSSILDRVLGRNDSRRDGPPVPISITDWARMFPVGSSVNYNGVEYSSFQTNGQAVSFSGPVYACERWRVSVFSEARFAWQRIRSGRPVPGGLFGTPELAILETPWPGASTRDLLAVAEIDVAQYGNSYWTIEDGYFVRFNPTDVKVLTSAVINPINGEIIGEQLEGYAVVDANRHEVAVYTPQVMAHYKPMPAANSQWLGASWIAACMDDVESDKALTVHKRASIRNGSNITHVVGLDPELSPEAFDNFVAKFNESHVGPAMAGKTLFIQGGTDIKAVGQTFQEMALHATQGAGETRISSCSGVHPVIVGFSEGLQGSALNAGNYSSAKRNFVDGTIAPMWGAFVSAFELLLTKPGNDVRLWYDSRDIPFLAEDVSARATVNESMARQINALITAGFDPDAVIEAVTSNDMSILMGTHSGLYSVQLQPAGANSAPSDSSSAGAQPAITANA